MGVVVPPACCPVTKRGAAAAGRTGCSTEGRCSGPPDCGTKGRCGCGCGVMVVTGGGAWPTGRVMTRRGMSQAPGAPILYL